MDERLQERIRMLIRQFACGDRDAAVQELAGIGSPALPALAGALKSKDFLVQEYAIDALARIGDASSADALNERMLDDEDEGVRSKAAEALARLGEAGLPFLTAALEHKDTEVQMNASEALATMGRTAVPTLFRLLEHKSRHVRQLAAEALGEMEEPPLEMVRKAFIERRMAHEEFDTFCKSLAHKLAKGGFDRGMVALPKGKPDSYDMERIAFRKKEGSGLRLKRRQTHDSRRSKAICRRS